MTSVARGAQFDDPDAQRAGLVELLDRRPDLAPSVHPLIAFLVDADVEGV